MTYAANQKNLTPYLSYNPPKRNAIVKKVGILTFLMQCMGRVGGGPNEESQTSSLGGAGV